MANTQLPRDTDTSRKMTQRNRHQHHQRQEGGCQFWVEREPQKEGALVQGRGEDAFPDIMGLSQELAVEPFGKLYIYIFLVHTYFVYFLYHVMFHDFKRLQKREHIMTGTVLRCPQDFWPLWLTHLFSVIQIFLSVLP